MKKTIVLSSVVVLVILLALAVGPGLAQGPEPTEPITAQAAVGTAFTYQGRLTNGGSPANGACDFQFSLWDSLSNPTGRIGFTQMKTGVTVSEGLFTVQLDFEADAFTGDARWLEIAVRCPAASGTYTTLSPRQPLTPAPYALSLRPGAAIRNVAVTGAGLRLGSNGPGLAVDWAWDGVNVDRAGSPSITSPSAANNGFEVAGAQGNGLYVGRADERGVYVLSAGADGVYVHQAGAPSATTLATEQNGFEVAGAQGYGLFVGRADKCGVYVSSAGASGVHVNSAGGTGVFAHTTQASHEWGFYTPDKIYAGTTLASGGPLMLVAQSGDGGNLEPGDVVAVSGAGAAFAEGESPVALVQRAGPGDGAVMGVVYRRYVAEREVEEVQRDGQVEQQTRLHTRSAEGPIAPGDYLLVVVLGPAQVKVAAASGAGPRPGDLLTMAANGQAAKAAPVKVGETTSYAPGAVIGQAMSALDPTQDAGLVWVLVMPR